MDTFDPFNQIVNVTNRYGEVIPVPLWVVNIYMAEGAAYSALAGAQVGAALILLLALVTLTKPDKRRSPVFLLNCTALVSTFIANILTCTYYTSDWYSAYADLTSDFSYITAADKATSIADGLLTLAVVVAIEVSLVLQVHVVCVTLEPVHRTLVLVVSVAVAAIAIGWRVAQVVYDTVFNVVKEESLPASAWLVKVRDATLTASVCFFSLVFCLKLGASMRQRRRLGVAQWGPMQVIFIGGTQTLIIPAIFALAQFIAPLSRLNALILTSAALSLPLTSLWASAATDVARSRGGGGSTPSARSIFFPGGGGGTLGSTTTCCSSKGFSRGGEGGLGNTTRVVGGVAAGKAGAGIEVERVFAAAEGGDLFADLEMQELV